MIEAGLFSTTGIPEAALFLVAMAIIVFVLARK
jgi:hypothetical protein